MKLSSKFIESLSNQSESGMGYQKAIIKLKSGTEHKATILNSSVIMSVDGSQIGKCPFSEDDIATITVEK